MALGLADLSPFGDSSRRSPIDNIRRSQLLIYFLDVGFPVLNDRVFQPHERPEMTISRTLRILALDVSDAIMKAIGYDYYFAKGDDCYPAHRPVNHGVLGFTFEKIEGEGEFGCWYLGHCLLLTRNLPQDIARRTAESRAYMATLAQD